MLSSLATNSALVPDAIMAELKAACPVRFRLSAEIESVPHAVGSTMRGGSGLIIYLDSMSIIVDDDQRIRWLQDYDSLSI